MEIKVFHNSIHFNFYKRNARQRQYETLMSTFTENRMTAIGNKAVSDAMIDLNQRFKREPWQEEDTAAGRILYGYEGEAARLIDSEIRGGKKIRYLDETGHRGLNTITFVVVNANACMVQDQLLRILHKCDPRVILSNEVLDEYFSEYLVRYITMSDGEIVEFSHSEALPSANYETISAQKKLTSLQNKIRKTAFKKIQATFDWVDTSMLLPVFKT